MSADSRRRKIGLIGWWPFLDALAFFQVLMESRAEFVAVACAAFLYWKRGGCLLPSHLAAVAATALAMYSRINIWHFAYTFATSILASSCAGSTAWLAHATYLTAAAATRRLAFRISPRTLFPLDQISYLNTVVLKLLLMLVSFTAVSEAVGKVFQSDVDESLPRKGRKLAAMKSRQPLWTSLALFMTQSAIVEEDVCTNLKVRYVEEHLVGLEVLEEPKSVKVNDVPWPQVCWVDGVLVVFGLAPATVYRIHFSGTDTVVAYCSTANRDESKPLPSPLAQQQPSVAVDILLAEEKSRLRKSKKEQTKRLAALRQEIAAMSDRQDRSAKSDDRVRRKMLSLQDQVRQLQDEIRELESGESELNDRRPEAKAAFAVREREWNDKRIEHERVQKQLQELSSIKAAELRDLHSQIAEHEAQMATLQHKSEVLTAEASEISQATEIAVRAVVESRASNREVKQQRRLRQEQELIASIEKLERGVAEMQQRATLVARAADTWSSDWS